MNFTYTAIYNILTVSGMRVMLLMFVIGDNHHLQVMYSVVINNMYALVHLVLFVLWYE